MRFAPTPCVSTTVRAAFAARTMITSPAVPPAIESSASLAASASVSIVW